jgi:hypothetical protein
MIALDDEMKSSAGTQQRKDGGRGCHILKNLLSLSTTKVATTSRYTEYHESFRSDIEVFWLVRETVSVDTSDIALLDIRVETVACIDGRNRNQDSLVP